MFNWYSNSQINHLVDDLEETTTLLADYYGDDINEYIRYIEDLEVLYSNDLRAIIIKDSDIIDYKTKISLIENIDVREISKIETKDYYVLHLKNTLYCFSKTNLADNNQDIYIMNSCPLYVIQSDIFTVATNLFFVCLFSLLISFVIAYIFSNYITKPIRIISFEAKKIGNDGYLYNPKESKIEEINHIQNSLINLQKRLEETENLEKDFLSGVSHELKSPLTIIKSYTEMIKDFYLDDKEKLSKYLDEISIQIDVMNKHINDMKIISKVHSDVYNVKELINAKSSLLEICNNFKPEIVKKEIEFNLNVDDNLEFYANVLSVKYCFTNYISNAIKYTNNLINVNLYRKDNCIYFEVENNGKMIPKEDINRIWDHFYKGENSNSSGLGLFIVKNICVYYNYKYNVISEEDYTKFSIVIEE